MWKIVVGIIVVWIGLTILLTISCSHLASQMDACKPGIVTTEKNGQKSTTIDCTAGKS